MKACYVIPHPSTGPANATASIAWPWAGCVRDRDLGTWLSRYLLRGRMTHVERVKQSSPWTEVLEVHTRLFNSAMNGGGVVMKRKKQSVCITD